MEDYNFWADLLDTYQSLPDIIKALWIIVPPTFTLVLVALLRKQAPNPTMIDEPIYEVYRTKNGNLVAIQDQTSPFAIAKHPGIQTPGNSNDG